ncbi:peptidylprolyl isomerase [Sphingomonas koreensis]|nr:peptidylprolyl isomerase [Sphingomonas koreensis]
MLSLLRRLTHSKIGMGVTFVALIVIALAFAAGGVERLGGNGPGGTPSGDTVAQVGGTAISADALKSETQNEMSAYRQQNPQLTMPQFVEGGGFDATVERLINTLALQKFGEQQNMLVSKKAIDGQIASLPVLQGLDGKFDPERYKQVLAEQHLTDAGIRQQIAQQTYVDMLTTPTQGASQVPQRLAMPYASLLLEARSGSIGFVPTKSMVGGPAPTDQDIATYYQRHIDRYTVPERRVIRYAIVTPDTIKAEATPSEAEIAQSYKAQAARFAPTEKRTLKQVIVADQAAATALANKVKGGVSIDAAAKAAGLEAATVSDVTKADYAKQTAADVGTAVFAAPQGGVVGPLKAPLGWSVVRIDKVAQVPGQTLAQAHDVLAKELAAKKTNDLLGQLHDKIDDALTGGATFEEAVADQKLTPQQTPAVTVAGIDPENPTVKPNPAMTQIVASGFDAQPGDSPELVQVGEDGSFAIAALGKIVPAAPQPLAKLHDAVVRDFTIDRAAQAAHKAATTIVASINKGMSIGQAFAQAKVAGPAPEAVHATRAQLAANPQGAPPPLALMFSTPAKQAKLLEAPQNAGWLVVYTDTITRGDASAKPDVVKATREGLGRFIGREYAEEFAKAVRADLGVKKNDAAIADVRKALLGGASDDQP